LWPLTGLTPVCPYLSCTGEPKPGHSTSDEKSRRIASLNLLAMQQLVSSTCSVVQALKEVIVIPPRTSMPLISLEKYYSSSRYILTVEYSK